MTPALSGSPLYRTVPDTLDEGPELEQPTRAAARPTNRTTRTDDMARPRGGGGDGGDRGGAPPAGRGAGTDLPVAAERQPVVGGDGPGEGAGVGGGGHAADAAVHHHHEHAAGGHGLEPGRLALGE